MDEGLTGATRIARSTRIASRVLDGQAVIVVGDAQRLYTLNGVGTDVFALADGRSVDAIVAEIGEKYEVELSVARADVLSFVTSLLDAGALVIA